MKFTVITAFLTSLFGCNAKHHKLDGDGMEYVDSDYRTEYANAIGFENAPETAIFAVSYLDKDALNRSSYINSLFSSLPDLSVQKIQHFDFGGENVLLVIPRYREYVDITTAKGDKKYTIYNGEPFTVVCDADGESISIISYSHGGHTYCPKLDSENRLISSEDIWDITDYKSEN